MIPNMKYTEKWDLECYFLGGSHSESFLEELERLQVLIDSLKLIIPRQVKLRESSRDSAIPEGAYIEEIQTPSEIVESRDFDALKFTQPDQVWYRNSENFIVFMERMQEIDLCLRQCDAYILCLQSQDINDDRANWLRAEFSLLEASFQLFSNRLDDFLVKLDEDRFQALVSNPRLVEVRYTLEERRLCAKQKLSCEKEDLITELSFDGYHGWGHLYPVLVGEIKIPFEFEGKEEVLSFGQAENKMQHPDRKVRQEVFSRLESAWSAKSALFAQVLNHISGFRLQVYAKRGWTDPLKEPLFENRMSNETLSSMWAAVDEYKALLVDFMQAKAALMGVKQLSWYDVEAPLFESKADFISYDAGAEMVIEQFKQFHPRMGHFAKRAFKEKWIEAEDRPGKRPGGYCASFPKSRQSRIFMTYSGTMVNISTLAHELGHAYHTHMLDDLPSFAQRYRMNVAETASTFAEHIISDALLEQARTREEKLKILSERIQRSILFMMNIHARFLFETNFYEMRKTKFLSSEDLCSLMQHAQEVAYCGSLSEWHPYFWAAKLHFYFTHVPFYNFPYTFGYLFSLGIYNQAKKQGVSFAKNYDALLRESGMMSVEELAKKHFDFDLSKPHFWREVSRAAVADVNQFLKLIE
jgi:oligoendopeptidase F